MPKSAASDPNNRVSDKGTLCRSCGKRPGKPTALRGELTSANLCETCAALRKERIKQNRSATRGRR